MTVTALAIGDAAQLCGLTPDTLRYYERERLLLVPPDRDVGGRRRYDDADLRWITLLTRLRATGMPIRDIRDYAELTRAGGNEQARMAMLQAHRAHVLAQLDEVRAHLTAIDDKIEAYGRTLAATSAPPGPAAA